VKFLAEYSPPEQSALRNEICRDAPDVKIDYYLRVCDGQQVDPFSGLLYLTKRTSQGKDKWSVNASVDGSRLKASRTGQYAGSDEPVYDSEDGPHPKWCRVTVYRAVNGVRYAFTAKCRWEEFKPNAPNDFQWKGKPYHMLAKVTEVQALRKGFPDVVPASGEDEEDAVINEDVTPETQRAKEERAGLAVQWLNAVAAFKVFGKTEADLLAKIGAANKEAVTPENTETLRLWYEELQRA
jgi:phage recombination protein Bet